MFTKSVEKLPITKKQLDKFKKKLVKELVTKKAGEIENEFEGLCAEFDERFNKHEWIWLSNKDNANKEVYYIPEITGLMPNLQKWGCNYQNSYYAFNLDTFKNAFGLKDLKDWNFWGFSADFPTEAEARACFNLKKRQRYCLDSSGYIRVNGSSCLGLVFKTKNEYWCLFTYNNSSYINNVYKFGSGPNDNMWTIPIHRFEGANAPQAPAARALIYWIKNDLQPDMASGFNKRENKAAFEKLREFYAKYAAFMSCDDRISVNKDAAVSACLSGNAPEFLKEAEKIVNSNTVTDKKFAEDFIKDLIECDYKRVMLEPYDPQMLTQQNRGHWDLWDYSPEDTEGELLLEKPIVARDPEADVNKAGIVAVDFGTKSTIVAYEDENSKINLLQVGNGDYSKGTRAENFENPTILEFIHIQKFLNAYNEREGRPRTSFNDLAVSHTALDDLKNSDNSELYTSFFDQIKQWCGAKNNGVRIIDSDGVVTELPPFNEITDADLNPLQIYAYYLGSYINHMLQEKHIFLQYTMSFPVMYERSLREKMRRSFESGLKKTLPTALLSNKEAMEDFGVMEGASEPAAYAITALEHYGFTNKEQSLYYGVFDFGGGTTDFDYGLYRQLESGRYTSELLHFGAYGDRTLGGENLLDLLAFNVFKTNEERLLNPYANYKAKNADDNKKKKDKITFTWPADKANFPNSEKLISNSQESRLNMYNLREKLRPFFEAPESDAVKQMIDSAKIAVNLFTTDGTMLSNFELSLLKEPSKVAAQDVVKEIEYLEYYFQDINSEMHNLESMKEYIERNLAGAIEQTDDKDLITKLQAELDSTNAKLGATNAELNAIKVQLDDAHKAQSEQNSNIDNNLDLQAILKERIAKGIDNFFIALRDAFDKSSGGSENGVKPLSDIEEIAVFLAGNSSKSALVKELFNEYTSEKGKARSLLGFGEDQKMPKFTLYPPLGTSEAWEIQRKLGVEPLTDIDAPTGKTGVAYGLLLSREGGEIKVTDITPDGAKTPFGFFVGRRERKIFKVVIDNNTKLGVWYPFIDASEPKFDLFYTDQAVASANNAPISVAKRLTLKIDKVDPNGTVYVHPVNSNSIEYIAVANESELSDLKEREPKKIELS